MEAERNQAFRAEPTTGGGYNRRYTRYDITFPESNSSNNGYDRIGENTPYSRSYFKFHRIQKPCKICDPKSQNMSSMLFNTV